MASHSNQRTWHLQLTLFHASTDGATDHARHSSQLHQVDYPVWSCGYRSYLSQLYVL